MNTKSHLAKWEQRHAEADDNGRPAQVLLRNLHLLPANGTALDLACGRGASALLLAEQGLQVTAWDFSEIAIERLTQTAKAKNLSLLAEVRDIEAEPMPSAKFDVLLVSYFLERALLPAIKKAIKPGGLLLYETFTRTSVSDRGPSHPDWRLKENELLEVCSDMRIHYYREDAGLGDLSEGWRDVAMIVASRS